MLIIVVCNHLAMGIVLGEVFQFDIKDGCLNLVKSAVATCILEYVLLLTTIVGKSTDCCSQLTVICSYSSAISQSAKIFARIE